MKAAKVTLAGQDYFLVFNGAAMFEFDDAFGGSSAYFENTKGDGREVYATVCKAASILSEQGELIRRSLGYDKGPILTEEQALILAAPMEAARLRKAVMDAILAGYGREIEDDEDVDMGLLELERKQGKG